MPLLINDIGPQEVRGSVWEMSPQDPHDQMIQGLSGATRSLVSAPAHPQRQREKLYARHAVRHLGLPENYGYSAEGKPLLPDGHLSISHSKSFVAVASSGVPLGMDLQVMEDKINRIAHKFVGSEAQWLAEKELVCLHNAIWTCKEAMYKLDGKRGLDFKAHLHVEQIEPFQNQCIRGLMLAGGQEQTVDIHLEFHQSFILAFAFYG